MGNDEINEEENKNNENKINLDEIIENDCYEEVDLKKINKIIEQEKKWNKNSIIYSIKDLNFLDIEEEKKKFQNDNKSEKDKSNEKLFNKISEENLENYNISNDVKNEKNKEKDNILKNEENNINENKENNNINKQEEINKVDNSQDNKNDNNNTNSNNNIQNQNNINNNDTKEIIVNDNKVNNNQNLDNNLLKVKPRIKPTNTGDGQASNIEKNKEKEKVEKIQNNLKIKITNNKNGQFKQNNINEFYDIKNIIPEYRLNHLKDDEIIYSGTLEKILKIPGKDNKITYSQRFCILTKKYFAYYKSKESYISLNKPMLLLNNTNIKRIENTCFRDNTYYFGIILEVNKETKNLVDKVNSFVTPEGNSLELLLGFRTKEFEDMIKWVVILTYFTDEQNQRAIIPEEQ